MKSLVYEDKSYERRCTPHYKHWTHKFPETQQKLSICLVHRESVEGGSGQRYTFMMETTMDIIKHHERAHKW
jgi:hypothetical protein